MHPSSVRFLEATLNLLWAQWTAIGVAGVTASGASVVDPEALVVTTGDFGRWDARLFDEMLDWIAMNAAWVDLTRLKRLTALTPEDTARALAAVGDFVGSREGSRPWQTLAVQSESFGNSRGEPLFVSTSAGDGGTWGPLDEIFLAHGFERNPPALRGMSRAPGGKSPPCLRFRARGLTGIGARAEVLTYLWTHEWSHGRLIAERALYAKTAVAECLRDLAAAGLAVRRQSGRRILYRLDSKVADVGRPAPRYVDWAAALRGVSSIWRELREWPSDDTADHAAASHLAQALTVATPDLAAEGFECHVPDLRGWAAGKTEHPLRVVDGIIRRIEACV